uniref:nascent polypeptide-associated complex subunit alpha, muscle-specific form-like n=1 Tax=Nyctereutes procyonoides TaxID=34880 RepID=UPI002444AC9E|nr:nascent polypeptide-associated complex subunit alpha, muscle-specific form-like [Nyctereutes procyonoides]
MHPPPWRIPEDTQLPLTSWCPLEKAGGAPPFPSGSSTPRSSPNPRLGPSTPSPQSRSGQALARDASLGPGGLRGEPWRRPAPNPGWRRRLQHTWRSRHADLDLPAVREAHACTHAAGTEHTHGGRLPWRLLPGGGGESPRLACTWDPAAPLPAEWQEPPTHTPRTPGQGGSWQERRKGKERRGSFSNTCEGPSLYMQMSSLEMRRPPGANGCGCEQKERGRRGRSRSRSGASARALVPRAAPCPGGATVSRRHPASPPSLTAPPTSAATRPQSPGPLGLGAGGPGAPQDAAGPACHGHGHGHVHTACSRGLRGKRGLSHRARGLSPAQPPQPADAPPYSSRSSGLAASLLPTWYQAHPPPKSPSSPRGAPGLCLATRPQTHTRTRTVLPAAAVLEHPRHPILGTRSAETSPALPPTSPFFTSPSPSRPPPWAPVCQGYL